MSSAAGTSGESTVDSKGDALAASTGKLLWDVASRALSFLLSILLARRLGAEEFGAFAVAWYAAWMSAQVTDLGLHLAGLRGLSRRFGPRRFASLVLCKAVLTGFSLTALGLVAVSGVLASDMVVVLVLLFAQLAGSWVELIGVALRSRGHVAREGMLLFILRAGWLLGAAWAMTKSLDHRDLALGLATASLPAVALGGALAVKLLSGQIVNPSRAEVSHLARSATPLAVVSAITVVYLRADLFLLAALGDPSEVGLFTASFRVFEATFVLSGGLVAGAFPLVARAARRNAAAEPAHVVMALLLALALPVTIVLAGLAEPLLGLLVGDTFRDAAQSLTWLGLAVPAVYVNALTTHLLFAAGRPRVLVAAIALRLFVGVALDVLWIPSGGALGAARAVCAAEWTLTAVSLFATRDLLRLGALLGYGLRRLERERRAVDVMVPSPAPAPAPGTARRA